MPRFFLHVCNGHGEIRDEEGIELESHSAAHRIAVDSIRSMISEDARRGFIDLTGFITIHDEGHNKLLDVAYMEAFELRMPREQRE